MRLTFAILNVLLALFFTIPAFVGGGYQTTGQQVTVVVMLVAFLGSAYQLFTLKGETK